MNTQKAVAKIVDSVGLANPLSVDIERLCRDVDGSGSSSAHARAVVINTGEEAVVCLFRLDGQRLIGGIDGDGLCFAENCTVIAVGLERRILRKGIDARRLLDLVRDVL